MSEEKIAPCVNVECPNYTEKWPLNCGLDLGQKIKKCNTYMQSRPKRPITVQELFEAGALFVKGPNEGFYIITVFSIKNEAIVFHDQGKVKISECIDKGGQWTADRKTWHDFLVEDQHGQ